MFRVQLSVTAENTFYSKFPVEGGRPFKVGIVQGTTDSTVTVREYDVDGTTVIDTQTMTSSKIIDTQTMTSSKIIDTADGALYDVGVATGNFGSGTCLITVRQL